MPTRRTLKKISALAGLSASLIAASLLASTTSVSTARAADAPKLEIPFTQFTLPNGLNVILSEDHTVPIVSVNIIVKVGSRFEADRRSGFAHLFEHLMFMGTDRVPTGQYDAWMEGDGGWNNAWTSEDRTDYYDVGPAHELPLLLYLEADRLDALGKTMTAEKLEAQRKVVRNERRQRSENEPYAKVELRMPELLYPEGHPYHHPVIGSHEDLEAAQVKDVQEFFATYYVPSNLSLVVAGDFEPTETKALIEKYFGILEGGKTPPPPPSAPPAKLTKVVRETILDAVEFPKVVMAFHSPARFQPGDAELDILAEVLVEGKSSRLYKTLVYDKELAQSVSARQSSQDLSSYFTIEALARPNVKPEELEAAIDAELAKIVKDPVAPEELERAKNAFETNFVRRLESTEARASLLNSYMTFLGDPGSIQRDLDRYRGVSRDSLFSTTSSVLKLDQRVVIYVVPNPEEPAEKSGGSK
ncbi:MAG: pitrilysin family protein [Polyangiaceae bacterium]